MSLIAIPGDVLANSYITLLEAAAFLDTRLDIETWLDADTLDQERALRWATRLLDQFVDWDGTPRYTTQVLGWPRKAVIAETEVFRATSILGGGVANNFLFSGATITGPSGSFTDYQVNQWLTITGATQAANNGTWRIMSIATTLLTMAYVTFVTENSSTATLTGLTNAETIPDDIREATAEYALALFKASLAGTLTQTEAVRRLRHGRSEVEYFEPRQMALATTESLPRSLRRVLQRYGLVAGGGLALLARV